MRPGELFAEAEVLSDEFGEEATPTEPLEGPESRDCGFAALPVSFVSGGGALVQEDSELVFDPLFGLPLFQDAVNGFVLRALMEDSPDNGPPWLFVAWDFIHVLPKGIVFGAIGGASLVDKIGDVLLPVRVGSNESIDDPAVASGALSEESGMEFGPSDEEPAVEIDEFAAVRGPLVQGLELDIDAGAGDSVDEPESENPVEEFVVASGVLCKEGLVPDSSNGLVVDVLCELLPLFHELANELVVETPALGAFAEVGELVMPTVSLGEEAR